MRCGKWKSRPLSNHWKNSQGFTLLEVIIALGIVAVGILAVSRAITGFADTTITLEQRMLASWVASNRLETLHILKESPIVGTTHGSEEMADRVWYFRETTTATADPNLFRIDITVFADKEETEEVGQLYGYLLNEAGVNLPIITSEWVGTSVGSNLFEQSTFSVHQRANKFAPTERHRDSNIVGSNLFEQGAMGFGHET
jgi:general secretion pathway protein I